MTISPNEKFLRNLDWFLGHLDIAPSRIHVRGVWHDYTGGSAIGSPMLARDFAAWLEAGERATKLNVEDVACPHIRRPLDGGYCPDCVIFDGEDVAGERGTIRTRTEVYRWPMRAAMAKLRRVPVRPGRPNLALTLNVIARANGDLATAASLLSDGFPAMGDEETAARHFALALNRVRNLYRETPPVRFDPPVDRSESQLDAESAAQLHLPGGLPAGMIDPTSSPSERSMDERRGDDPSPAGAVNDRGRVAVNLTLRSA